MATEDRLEAPPVEKRAEAFFVFGLEPCPVTGEIWLLLLLLPVVVGWGGAGKGKKGEGRKELAKKRRRRNINTR